MTKQKGLKLGTRALLLALAVFSFSAFAYAHDPQYDEGNYTYRAGYTAGFEHGDTDQQSRSDFNFRHDRKYQTASRDGYRHDSRQDLNFRLGYVEGYADGYFKRNSPFDSQRRHGSTGYNYHNNNDQGYGFPDRGVVTVFTNTGYTGYSRDFTIGQYPSLEGRLDDDIQSLRMNGSLRVVLFEDDKFEGKRIVLDRNTWDLGDFRKKAGSMIIERARYGQFR